MKRVVAFLAGLGIVAASIVGIAPAAQASHGNRICYRSQSEPPYILLLHEEGYRISMPRGNCRSQITHWYLPDGQDGIVNGWLVRTQTGWYRIADIPGYDRVGKWYE